MRTTLMLVLLSVQAWAQHDPGRAAVRFVARDQLDQARASAEAMPRRNNSPISAAERHYILSMIAARAGDESEATEQARAALASGLPVSRLQAGPREVFATLHARPAFQELLQTGTPLVHGPLVGSLTDRSARVWIRCLTNAEARIEIGTENSGARRTAPVMVEAAHDFTAVIEVGELEPNTTYEYGVVVNGKRAGEPHTFRTHPRQGHPASFRIGFGGGAGFTPPHERMWTTIADHSLEAFLLLGDNVYIDDPEHVLTQRYCYYRRQSQPEWRRLAGSTGIFTIYDDHDFGTDDVVAGPLIEMPPWKRRVWEVYRENWANPAYGGGARQPGCYYDFYIADVHFIMLDCRYYRDLKGGSMLGPVQKAWLMKTLKASRGTFKLLVSSVPWSPGVKPGSRDTWDGFPGEREDIFRYLEREAIEGVLLVAADRHRSDMRRIARPDGYDLIEFMSSRLTNVHTHGLVKKAKGSTFIMGYNKDCSFGLLSFDTRGEDPRVTYTIVNIDGDAIDSRTVNRRQLVKGGAESRP